MDPITGAIVNGNSGKNIACQRPDRKPQRRGETRVSAATVDDEPGSKIIVAAIVQRTRTMARPFSDRQVRQIGVLR